MRKAKLVSFHRFTQTEGNSGTPTLPRDWLSRTDGRTDPDDLLLDAGKTVGSFNKSSQTGSCPAARAQPEIEADAITSAGLRSGRKDHTCIVGLWSGSIRRGELTQRPAVQPRPGRQAAIGGGQSARLQERRICRSRAGPGKLACSRIELPNRPGPGSTPLSPEPQLQATNLDRTRQISLKERASPGPAGEFEEFWNPRPLIGSRPRVPMESFVSPWKRRAPGYFAPRRPGVPRLEMVC
jgi:hypothetical protein